MSVKSLGKAMAKKLGEAGYVKTALTAGILGHSYAQARNEGQSKASAVIGTVGESVVASVMHPAVYVLGGLAIGAPKAGVQFYEAFSRKARELERAGSAPFMTNTFVDTQQTYTMRQAGVAMLQQAKYNVENHMLGNEAQFLHR
jgi:hypothetical protein